MIFLQGLITTEMTEKVLAAMKGNEGMEYSLKTASALQRFGNPEEVSCQSTPIKKFDLKKRYLFIR
jgi:hypothetical protein